MGRASSRRGTQCPTCVIRRPCLLSVEKRVSSGGEPLRSQLASVLQHTDARARDLDNVGTSGSSDFFWYPRCPTERRALPTSARGFAIELGSARFAVAYTPPGKPMKILMILTSHAELGDTGKKTGFWLEEFAAPYYVFKDAGAQIVLATPLGGEPPLDPKSDLPDAQTEATRRFKTDRAAQDALAQTLRLAEVRAADFDGVFYPGGHGPLWDLASDPNSIALIEGFLSAGKPVAAVCHAPGVLRSVKTAAGEPVVKGRNLTGFSDSEEKAAGLTEVVPFLVEDVLKALGAHYSKAQDWQAHVVTDGLLITGQNPASSEAAARTLLQALEQA